MSADTPDRPDRSGKAAGRGPELVFAVASPIGTPTAAFQAELDGGLHAYGYTTEWIKLSRLLLDEAQQRGITIHDSPENERVTDLMDVGDALCEESQSSAAVALHGISEIRQRRAEYHSSTSGELALNSEYDKAVPRRVWIIDSLKRLAEVTQLRQIYGDHVMIIGIQASLATRKAQLTEQIRPQVASLDDSQIENIVDKLVTRDLDERERGVHGQSILKTVPLADAFIDVDKPVGPQVNRLLDLLFGNPSYPVPTDDEFGMHLASASATRSPELGLKVGAAIMSKGTVVSLGVNAHPTAETASPAYDRSASDIRQLILDTLRNLADAAFTDDAKHRLRSEPDKYVRDLLEGQFASARINHLTEFQPTVHAEMAAILEAVQQGKSVANATVYVTAYPCHGCAKHLLRLGLPVRYIEPYPKGRAEAMYGQEVVNDFRPFTGIAPRRFQQLFAITEDRKNPEGVRKPWTVREKTAAEPHVDPLIDQASIALREAVAVARIPDMTT